MPSPRRLLIHGGQVIDPSGGISGLFDVVVEDGRISALVEPDQAPSGIYRIEADGMVVTPGFVDLHTHLRFPGFPEKETIASGTRAAAAGGFTTVCAMANTRPVVDTVEILRVIEAEVRRSAAVRVRQLAAVTMGLAGEHLTDMPALVAAGAVAFSDDGKPVGDVDIMESALRASAELGAVISVHEERAGSAGAANPGPARQLGLAAWPCTWEAEMVARDVGLLERTGGRLHIAHVSCAETVQIIRMAKQRGLPVTAEATPHHLRLDDSLLLGTAILPPGSPQTKVNPPLRDRSDVEALVAGLADGTIDAVATDHAPHAAPDKEGSFAQAAFGFTGLETALPVLLDLVRAGSLSLPALVERLTEGPARVFGLDAGTLRPGAPADVTIFDPEARWTVAPEILESRGKNSPLLGHEMRGRVSCTLVGGQVVHVAGV
ncbi:MAG TPA: dihydroorotase [Chloroflexota bacterium]|nr:dihydroorotase [Chloroflexota bacterium]